jgi:transcription initiation factor TFIID subunit 6
VPKGPGANPALAALAGNDNVPNRPSVKHIVSKELILYFDKIQAALLDDGPEPEVMQLRLAALASVREDPGLHQLVPYFINFIASQVTHHLDDTFTLRQVMELTASLIDNKNIFLDPYANPISAPVLTCLMARRIGSDDDVGADALKEQYQLREFAASLVGRIAARYARTNALLRPKLTRTCLKYFLDPTKPPAVLFGAISGLAAAGGPEAVRVLVLRNLKSVDAGILQPLRERRDRGDAGGADYDMLVGGIMRAVATISPASQALVVANSSANGHHPSDAVVSDAEAAQLADFVGPILAERIAAYGDRTLIHIVLESRHMDDGPASPD